ncbi:MULTISPECIES: thioredoxin [Rhodanobacter]|uniref:thioredoxin n=1 Tax=Rhodanobacter TaxID=75309 RepID=UPI00041F315C|nr:MULTISPECIES: thioredoxin [Rhodanobacter]KZC19254.1 co-chaperone YbbN [Rhodanobacter denitrificans]UJJ52181.1 thioredoxin [Rhodanobacter denitrificans]UJM94928.1 thioredoxin [Rhodanobacter denitrificans]UJM98458.1 thioredoxin [Rhodanobacter denitrificans]UJN22129.1 thioredoxin [Rhodanobacter denitrificans]
MTDAAAVSHVFDVDQQTFEADVLQASLTTPVLVDFWATWCEPCKTLGPMLEKLAAEYHGAFRLGKVDVDTQQELAGMFGIRSIPTVVLVKDGQVLDGFTGALPEGQLREFLSRHVQPLEASAEPAEAATVPETAEQAINRLQQAIATEPNRPELKLDLALALMRAGNVAAAKAELAALPANLATDARAVRLRSELELAHALKDAPGIAELRQRVQADAGDWAARDQLGVHLLLEGDVEAGLEQFLVILQKARDWNDGQAKKRLLAAFATLDDAELVGRYRRRMASLLF